MRHSKLTLVLVAVFLVSIFAYGGDLEDAVKTISIDSMIKTIEFLASPECEGRLTGSVGYAKAALWFVDRFKEIGAVPVYEDYLQPYPTAYNETGESSFSLIVPADKEGGSPEIKKYDVGKDFLPFLSGGFGEVEGEVVFAGYGTSAPELGWDDYDGLDVKGKIVAVFYGVPKIPGKNFDIYNNNVHRSSQAYSRGAIGFITFYEAMGIVSTDHLQGFPMIVAGERITEFIFNRKGYDLKTVKNLLTDGHKISFDTGLRAKIKVDGIHHPKATGYNVVALIPGSDPVLKNECILFGGHLDHIGKWPVLFPGANDNASGCAIIFEIAKAFSKMEPKPKRSIMFALFGGEEMGLIGSKYMVSNLPPEPMKIIHMINIDSNGIGNSMWVTGGKSFPELYSIIEKQKEKLGTDCKMGTSTISTGRGGSDFDPFLRLGIPTYANWTGGGTGGGYHTENDTIYYITPKIMEDIAKIYFAAVYEYADR